MGVERQDVAHVRDWIPGQIPSQNPAYGLGLGGAGAVLGAEQIGKREPGVRRELGMALSTAERALKAVAELKSRLGPLLLQSGAGGDAISAPDQPQGGSQMAADLRNLRLITRRVAAEIEAITAAVDL